MKHIAAMDDPSLSWFLLIPSELTLKGANRRSFEQLLMRNLKNHLAGLDATLSFQRARYLVACPHPQAEELAGLLASFIGISGFSAMRIAEKSLEDVTARALEVAMTAVTRGHRFKVVVRREDKTFPLSSYQTACELGAAILQKVPGTQVDVHHPDWVLYVEVRARAFLFLDPADGERGLPVGCAGKGLVLLSGGIDSPVAAYLMAKRGLALEAVHFHSYPYTSEQALDKVKRLARRIALWAGPIRLHVVPFTAVQVHIRENSVPGEHTLHGRAGMVWIAHRIAQQNRCNSLISGESLSQVASQTAESMRYTGMHSDLAMFRPLIGSTKEEIVAIARRIGTYDISIEPWEDCCSVFAPQHPIIRPNWDRIRESWDCLSLTPLLEKALEDTRSTLMRSRES